MNVKVINWRISKLLKTYNKINEQPEYQRGKVWNNQKSALLIDSIIRGIDIPKIYLRKLPSKNQIHQYEVADGQQRLNAINLFYHDKFKLIKKSIKGLDTSKIDNYIIGGLTYSELPQEIQQRFKDHIITVSVIDECSENEVRTLFGRLQEGVSLNPAEKRNAIISTVGKHIESIALNHKFFDKTKISDRRFKHHDYLANLFALIFYKNNEDLKANLLEKMYLDQSLVVSSKILKNIDSTLDFIYDLDHSGGKRIVNKYSFVDFGWLFICSKPKSINAKSLKKDFNNFERKRLKAKGDLDKLLNSGKKEDKLLYDYILAFDRSGATSDNIEVRSNVFNTLFSKHLNK